MLENIVVLFLCLAPLPSFIAWSSGANGLSGFLATHLGPVSLLKVGAVFLAFYVWKNRSKYQTAFLRFALAMLFVGTLSALYAGVRCGSPWLEMREWAVMVLGCIAGASVAALPRRKAFAVCSTWVGLIVFSVALEVFAKGALKWIIAHFFDPTRVDLDPHGLMGFWDIASLGKLAMLACWTFAFTLFRNPRITEKLKWPIFIAASVVLFLIIVGSTERGPIIGFAAGVAAFVFQEFRRTRNWKMIGIVTGLGVAAVGAAFLVIPAEHLMPRVRTMLFLPDNSYYGQQSAESRNQRIRISRLTFDTLAHYPMGNACIPEASYLKYNLDPVKHHHAHSLILHQFRARGMIWGLFHLVFWIWALTLAFQRKTTEGALLFAGLSSVFVLGLVDHPWLVLNQATMIGTLLLSSFSKKNDAESF